MSDAQVSIDFIAKFDQATKSLDAFAKKSSEQLTGVQESFKKIGEVAEFIGLVFIAEKLGEGLSHVVEQAIEGEKAVNDLANALRVSGDYSEQNIKAFEKLSEELSKTSKYSDDAILSQFTLAKQFGATNTEAELLVKAAIELAARTGKDLPTATELLGRSLDGTAGKLNELVPQIKGLTAAQLVNNGAAKLIAETYGGSATNALNTFDGSLSSLESSFNNFLKQIGNSVVQNKAVVDSIKSLATFFGNLGDVVKDNKQALTEYVTDGLLVFAKGVLVVVSTVQFLQDGIESVLNYSRSLARNLAADILKVQSALGLTNITNKEISDTLISESGKDIDATRKRLKIYDDLQVAIIDLGSSIETSVAQNKDYASAVNDTSTALDNMGKTNTRVSTEILQKGKALIDSLKNIGQTESQTITKQFQENVNILVLSATKSKAEFEALASNIKKLTIKFDKELADSRRKELEKAFQNPIDILFKPEFQGIIADKFKEAFASGAALFKAVLSGKDGAAKLIGDIAQKVLGIPGVSEIVQILAKGPVFVKQMVKDFIDAIPDIINAIVDDIPAIVDALSEKFSDPEFLARLGTAIAKAATFGLTSGISAFVPKLLDGADKFIGKILDGAGKFIETLIQKLGDAIGGIAGGPGGGLLGNILGPAKGLLGGIGGGLPSLPSLPKFGGGNSLFKVASLSSTSPDEAPQGQFLPVSINIGQRELANVMLDLSRAGFRTS